ncbi:MAG: hypothetical protein ACR2MG_05100 [Pyrinomonadaceae bacterium]
MRTNALKYRFHLLISFSFILFFSIILSFTSACRSPQKIDLRGFAPNDAIVYLETDDLSKILNALTENKSFQELNKNKIDFSTLKNVQVAAVVTGFETSEKQVTDENSILNFQPHFVAIAETHAWQWQTLSLVENQINDFIRETYGDDAKLEASDKNDGKWFVWTAKDGRKVFAFVQNSRIYFGNDDTAIEKCLAVRRGEIESLLKNENLSRAFLSKPENNLAFGYISPEGVAQIANLAGVSVAVEATESGDGRSFIARVLPQILRNTTKEIVWTAQKTEQGIEDKFFVSLTTEVSSVVKETLASPAESKTNAPEFLPDDTFSATRYSLKNPLIAWRSLLLVTAKNTDAVSGKLLIQFSDSLLEPYGISDAETFLSAIESDILTAQFDPEGEKSVFIVTVKDVEKLQKSIADINFKSLPEKQENAEIRQSQDKTLAAAFVENKLILGDTESVLKCLQTRQNGQNFKDFPVSSAVSVTFAKDIDSAEKIVSVLGTPIENKKIVTSYLTETRFTEKGIERKTVSDFGLLGTILKSLNDKN